MKKRTDRIGEEATNRQGLKMRIVEYENSKSIEVLFVDTGEIKKTRYTQFINGEITADLDNFPVLTGNGACWRRAGCALTLTAVIAAVVLFLSVVFSGCQTHRSTQPTLNAVPVATNTDTKITHIETIDTVLIEIPDQSAERTIPGKESHLETDYAESDARINEDGTLTHTLNNKPTKHPVPVKNSTDTVYVDKFIEKPVPVEVPKEVERELTSWQKTRLNTWGWLATAFILCAGWICRKPLITLARRLLTKTT